MISLPDNDSYVSPPKNIPSNDSLNIQSTGLSNIQQIFQQSVGSYLSDIQNAEEKNLKQIADFEKKIEGNIPQINQKAGEIKAVEEKILSLEKDKTKSLFAKFVSSKFFDEQIKTENDSLIVLNSQLIHLKKTQESNAGKIREIKKLIKMDKDAYIEKVENFFNDAFKQIKIDNEKNNFNEIQEIELFFKKYFSKSNQEDELHQKIYQLFHAPHSNLLPKRIVQNRLAAHSAAKKGNAFQIYQKIKEQSDIEGEQAKSYQIVTLIPKLNAVIKQHRTAKAKEEEEIIDALFSLMSEEGTVGLYNTEKDKVNATFAKEYLRGITFEECKFFMDVMKDKMSEESQKKLQDLESHSKNFFLTPLLTEARAKAYELCEHVEWAYLDEKGAFEVVDFKTLHLLYLQKKIKIKAIKIPNNIPKKELVFALLTPWTVLAEESNIEGDRIKLTNVHVKELVKMTTLSSLNNDALQEAILMRLSDEAQVNAVLTAQFQFLDLHEGNIGVAPKVEDNTHEFQNCIFCVNESPVGSFNDLILLYLEGKIESQDVISYVENEVKVEKTLKELPELQKALNCKWDLIFFDTDQSLYENNNIRMVKRGIYKYPEKYNRKQMREEISNLNKKKMVFNFYGLEKLLRSSKFYFPLRSAFLAQGKNFPLSKNAIETLMHRDMQDADVKQWLNNEHSPIFKQLPPDIRADIQSQLIPYISKYCLYEKDHLHPDMTIENLKNQFISEISNSKEENLKNIWEKLEEVLYSVLVNEGDTWENLSKQYQRKESILRTINPQEIKSDEKIRIFDITSQSSEALKKRKELAAQFFPKITLRQQKALLERQQGRKIYLDQFQALKNSSLGGKDLYHQLYEYINQPTTPFSSSEREIFLKFMNEQKNLLVSETNTKSINQLKEIIEKKCQPTYLNLAKAMYPLLADVYELSLLVHGEQEAGYDIGVEPIEDLVYDALTNFSQNTPGHKLAKAIGKKVIDLNKSSSK